MENFPKKRGRPRKIPQPLGVGFGTGLDGRDAEVLREFFAQTLGVNRTHANAHYAEIGRDVVEGLAEQVRKEIPADPAAIAKRRLGLDWILARSTVLTELGRMMDGEIDPTPDQVARFQAAVFHVADRHDRHTAKSACAYIRGRRMGETKRRDRIAALHHDLNAAINLHRQRHPESTWADIRRALELTAGQIEHKRS
jgi:hypothetical protein